jgi:hypothetical protein
MKYVSSFYKYVNESQSKKLKKYFSFSTVMTWYRDNKSRLASILNVDESELADEDELLSQSYGLVNRVINTQSSGDDGNRGRAGFTKFDKLEKNLIHDILHNMYQVQSKEFDKDLDAQEYSESEIIEEIEVLGIEESFMKYMDIPYPKTDFINQNINMLVSHLMLSILRHDCERIAKILDGEVEPYIEVYGKQYPVKGTPFEEIFMLFQNQKSDKHFNLTSSKDLKEYLIHLINVSYGIDITQGDRAMYPNENYYGEKYLHEVDGDEQEEYYKEALDSFEYHLIVDDKFDIDDVRDKPRLHRELKRYLVYDRSSDGDDYEDDYEDYGENPNQLEIPFNESITWAKLKFKEYVKKKISYNDSYDDYIHEIDDDMYLIWDDKMNLINRESLVEAAEERFRVSGDGYSDDHEFINKEDYERYTLKQLVDEALNDDTCRAILRRNFRTNDAVVNNTKLGIEEESGGRYYSRSLPRGYERNNYSQSIDYRNGNYNVTSFYLTDSGWGRNFTSLSKYLTTENAQKLYSILNELRGYLIKNIDQIKDKEKQNRTKFTKGDIATFKAIDMNNLKLLRNNILKLKTIKDITIRYNMGYHLLELGTSEYGGMKISEILKGMIHFKSIKRVLDKIQSKDDIDYLFNWVNNHGVANYKSFDKIMETANSEEVVSHIEKLESDLTPSNEKFINSIINNKIDLNIGDSKFLRENTRKFNTNDDVEEFCKEFLHTIFNPLGEYTMKVEYDKSLIEKFLNSNSNSYWWLITDCVKKIEISIT